MGITGLMDIRVFHQRFYEARYDSAPTLSEMGYTVVQETATRVWLPVEIDDLHWDRRHWSF